VLLNRLLARARFRHLQVLLQLAELGSVRRAAEAIGMTQPGVTQLLAELERLLETALFQRHARGVRLTPAGADLLPMARQMMLSLSATDEAAAARTEEFAGTVLGKQVVRCSDRSGFVVNALLVPYLLAAIRMVEAGFATVEDVDKAVVAGLSHPMGPLRLSDLVGLDTLKLIADKMFEEFKETHYAPPPLLLRMVEAGQLGKKSGRGFYSY